MRRRTSYIPQPAQVKALREETGAGMLDCKRALNLCYGDHRLAIEFLNAKGTCLVDGVVREAYRNLKCTIKNQLIYSNWFDLSLAEGVRVYVELGNSFSDKEWEGRVRQGSSSSGGQIQLFNWPNPLCLDSIVSIVFEDPATKGCLLEMARRRWGNDLFIESMNQGNGTWWRTSSIKTGRNCRWYEEEWLAIANAIVTPDIEKETRLADMSQDEVEFLNHMEGE